MNVHLWKVNVHSFLRELKKFNKDKNQKVQCQSHEGVRLATGVSGTARQLADILCMFHADGPWLYAKDGTWAWAQAGMETN